MSLFVKFDVESDADPDYISQSIELLRGVVGPVWILGSDGEEVRSLVVGGAQDTQAGGDSGGMPLSVGRSRPDQTATFPEVIEAVRAVLNRWHRGYSANDPLGLPALQTAMARFNTSDVPYALELQKALERTLSWLTSYPGDAAMGPKGPYEQARAALAKNPNPSGHGKAEASRPSLDGEASGPVGLGPDVPVTGHIQARCSECGARPGMCLHPGNSEAPSSCSSQGEKR